MNDPYLEAALVYLDDIDSLMTYDELKGLLEAWVGDRDMRQVKLPDARIDPEIKDMMWAHISAAENHGLLVRVSVTEGEPT